MTVVVSTHYTSEAQQADVVGFLRNGRMVFEGNYREVLQDFNVQSLDMAFYESSVKYNEEVQRYGRISILLSFK